MKLFFLYYELRPKPGSENFDSVGGAFVNCFVKALDEYSAKEKALYDIAEQGFEAISLDELRVVQEGDYSRDEEWAQHLDQAEAEGASYLYHAWPPGPQDDDSIH